MKKNSFANFRSKVAAKMGRGDRRYMARPEDDETLVMIAPDGHGNGHSRKRNWRTLPIGHWEPLLDKEVTLEGVSAVLPAGVFLKIASNANSFHVELILEAPGLQDSFSVVVPPSGAVYDLNLVKPPLKNAPRSGEWCDMFGVITRENLSNGIVEKRQDGSLVVYRQFRRTPNMLTPFGLYFSKDLMSVSESDLMASHVCSRRSCLLSHTSKAISFQIITEENFEKLLNACSGVPAAEVRIMARPLLEKDREKALGEETLPLHVEISSPVVLTVPPPPTDKEAPPLIRMEESLM